MNHVRTIPIEDFRAVNVGTSGTSGTVGGYVEVEWELTSGYAVLTRKESKKLRKALKRAERKIGERYL